MRPTGAILLLLLAGCAQRSPVLPPVAPPPPQVVPPTPAPAPAPPPAPVMSLAGEWRVAAIDGREIAGSVGIALRGDAREIWWEPRCAGYVRSYVIQGTRFSTGPYVGFRPPRPGDPPPLICLIAPPPQMPAIFNALAVATTVSRLPNNGIELSGGGHSLLLFSQ